MHVLMAFTSPARHRTLFISAVVAGVLLTACRQTNPEGPQAEGPESSTGREEGEECIIFLTFDDGPHFGTDDVIEVLDSHGIHGTFFVCGYNFGTPTKPPDAGAGNRTWRETWLRKMVADGHLVGNHSWHHQY